MKLLSFGTLEANYEKYLFLESHEPEAKTIEEALDLE